MKIIVNVSNLVVGGALQVALSFLEESKSLVRSEDKFFVFLSPKVASQVDVESFPPNFTFYHFSESPASILSRRKVIKSFGLLEKVIKPDIVFSLFGPSYWRPQAPQIMGFALGWVINPDSIAFKYIGLRKRIENIYKKLYVKRDADFYIVETADVKGRLEMFLKIPPHRIAVVSNTYNHVFNETFPVYPIDIEPDVFNMVSICANYPHKNLKVIRQVIPFLEAASFKCKFWLTIPWEQYKRDFAGLDAWVSNLGPVDVKYCPSIYEQCDALFLPTLLESFTASYPEAMKMRKPILTSNLDFARSICADAAEYFDPLDPHGIAEAIMRVGSDLERQQTLVRSGTSRLKLFPSAKERATQYLKICEEVASSWPNL